MLFGRDELVAKEDDLVREQRGADFGDGRVILFAGEIDPRNFGADPGRRRRDLQTDKAVRSEEHTSELQSLMRISYAVFCLKKKKITPHYIRLHRAHQSLAAF